jgi:hypothetical protein
MKASNTFPALQLILYLTHTQMFPEEYKGNYNNSTE